MLLQDLTPGAALALPLPGSLTLAADYQATISRSNLDVYTFNRKVLSLVLIWSY